MYVLQAVSLNPMGTGGLNWERINNSALTYYVCGDTTFQTSTSRYGARTKSSQTGVVKQAKSFLSSGPFSELLLDARALTAGHLRFAVDTAQIDTLNGQIATLHRETKQLQVPLRQIEAQRAELEQGKHEHEAAFVGLRSVRRIAVREAYHHTSSVVTERCRTADQDHPGPSEAKRSSRAEPQYARSFLSFANSSGTDWDAHALLRTSRRGEAEIRAT